MHTFIPFFHLCSGAFQTIFAMNVSLGKMKGHFTFWALVTFVLPAVQHGIMLFHTDPYRVKGGSTVRFFSLAPC